MQFFGPQHDSERRLPGGHTVVNIVRKNTNPYSFSLSVNQLWMLCDLKIQFERSMNDGKYHVAEPLVTAIAALNKTEGLYRQVQRTVRTRGPRGLGAFLGPVDNCVRAFR